MDALRGLSSRPYVVVDERGRSVGEGASTSSRIGLDGPLGRERCLYALPLNGSGPVQWWPHVVIRDQGSVQLADSSGNVIGEGAVWISRLLTARWVEDSRRLG